MDGDACLQTPNLGSKLRRYHLVATRLEAIAPSLERAERAGPDIRYVSYPVSLLLRMVD